jgi:zearalenone synthase (highly reducing iterative type I polyketide synthase)
LYAFSSHDREGLGRNAAALVAYLDCLGPAAMSPAYLANLAHTLSGARARLSWRASCVASTTHELRNHLATRAGDDARRSLGFAAPQQVSFVFTGQGAQWARMGVEMLHRPVFGASVTLSAGFLGDLGCPWDPVTELLRGAGDGSRLDQPDISQPICTVLQIALVDELRAWGVMPTRVVGHSSGEIAAAYSIGALSHRDAVIVAYFRGVAATRLLSESMGVRLGMMAVGCSRDEADTLVAQSNLNGGGKTVVACVNSPTSVTLSGDVDSLERLRGILDERNVFARRLKVEMAYHSAYMNSAVNYYLSAIDNIEPLAAYEGQGTMISSVTGDEINPEALGPYYWVRNLVSPVLFSDAVKELVSSENGDDNAVHLMIEVGPHGALRGPVEQTLSHHGIKNISYESMLTRGKDALNTSLHLASKLYIAGISINFAQVNGDLHTQQLVDLPPYQWNHSTPFRHETRIQRELMTRRYPSKSLLGAKMAMMDETQHVWRGFVRLVDEPWIRGHTIAGTVLLPAAGMVSMALEAVQQLTEPEKSLRSLRMRDVSFFAAMVLPEESATEVITTLRPHLVAMADSSTATWWEFTISSSLGVDQLRDHCRGLVSIEYKESTSAQMAYENAQLETARIADYYRIVKECADTLCKAEFYAQCAKMSWHYGELFQGVEKIHIGDGKAAYDIKLVDLGETYSEGLERPFLIHGAGLDAIIHGALGSTYRNGRFQQETPLLPTYIGELDISLDIPDHVGYILPTSCVSKKFGIKALSSNIVSFDDTVSRTFLSMTDFRLTDLGDDNKQNVGQIKIDPADITSEVRWNYALEFMSPSDIASIVSTATPEERAVQVRDFCLSRVSSLDSLLKRTS